MSWTSHWCKIDSHEGCASASCCCGCHLVQRKRDYTTEEQPSPITYLEQAIALFKQKNAGYSKGTDLLANFANSAPVIHGKLTPLEYAAVLVAKQDDAVWSCLSEPNERKLKELPERLMDGIVYRAIMLCLLARQHGRPGMNEPRTTCSVVYADGSICDLPEEHDGDHHKVQR